MKISFCLWFTLLTAIGLSAQKVYIKPKLAEGKTYIISAELKNTISQHAAGQPIDFSVSATATHSYQVSDVDSGNKNIVLHHQAEHFTYRFEGMGQQKKFDSGKEDDLSNDPGGYFKALLGQSFDLTIDPAGKVLETSPEKIELSVPPGGMIIVMNMLKDLTDIVYPPEKGLQSFFAVLPPYEIGIGDTWTDSIHTENGKSVTENTLSAITDSALIVTFRTKSTDITKMQMMGGEATFSMNSSATGKILINPVTGVMMKKTITEDAAGTTETIAGTVPTTGKKTITLTVKEE